MLGVVREPTLWVSSEGKRKQPGRGTPDGAGAKFVPPFCAGFSRSRAVLCFQGYDSLHTWPPGTLLVHCSAVRPPPSHSLAPPCPTPEPRPQAPSSCRSFPAPCGQRESLPSLNGPDCASGSWAAMCPGGAGRGPVYTWDAQLRWAPPGSLPGVRGLGQEWAEGEGGLSLWTEAWRFMRCWLVCLPPASNAATWDGRDKPARPR